MHESAFRWPLADILLRWADVRSGSIASFCPSADRVRSSSNNGHFREESLRLKRAIAQSRCAPARCAGARAKRPVAS